MKKHIRFAVSVFLLAFSVSAITGCTAPGVLDGDGMERQVDVQESSADGTENAGNAGDQENTENTESSENTENTDTAENDGDSGEEESYTEQELMDEIFGVTDSVAARSVEEGNTEAGDDVISTIPKAEDPFEDDPSVGALLNLLESIYSAAPGTAGCSIKLEYASKLLLDFSETYSGNISTVYLTMNTNVWFDEKIEYGFDSIREDFAECLALVKESAETIAADPSVPTPLASDYDYTLQYDSYDLEKLEEICYYIGLATKVPE